MEEMKVQRYSTEVKVYILATVMLTALIVGLIWWNASEEAKREAQLLSLYNTYLDLENHIKTNVDINGIAACEKLMQPQISEEQREALSPEELQKIEQEFQTSVQAQRAKRQDFTNRLAREFNYLTDRRPQNPDPALMTDALLFRLTKTYDEFSDAMEKLASRCGDLTEDQVAMRKRRFNKALARFSENLRKVNEKK